MATINIPFLHAHWACLTRSMVLLSALAMQSVPALADTVVSATIEHNTVQEVINLQLLTSSAPITTTNFLKYVNNTTVNGGLYTKTFIHRNEPGFVLQLGGYSYDASLGGFVNDPQINNYPEGLRAIVTDEPIINEFKLSNLAGTIAMAKRQGDANSATSQWFINLADNASILDQSNGGYTVFGRLLGDGLTVANQLAAQPTYDFRSIHSAFNVLPLDNYTSGPVQEQNLYTIQSIKPVFNITQDADFGAVLTGASTGYTLTIDNISGTSMTMGAIASTSPLAAPFSIDNANSTCDSQLISNNASCQIVVKFDPLNEGEYSEEFNIEVSLPAISYVYKVFGESANSLMPVATLSATEADFGEVLLYDPAAFNNGKQFNLGITSSGNVRLNVNSINLAGANTADFSFVEKCTDRNPINKLDSCVINIFFQPGSEGEKTAEIIVSSDDSNNPVQTIQLYGVGSVDGDGVPAAIENAVPNNGDGNNDGILDSIQKNVTSFTLASIANKYVTTATDPGNTFTSAEALTIESFTPRPGNKSSPYEIYNIVASVPRFPAGIEARVGIIIPGNIDFDGFYMFGPTPDNTEPHWYNFSFDGATGAEIFKNARMTAPDGTVIQRTLIILYLRDGFRGDSDLLINGSIHVTGGPLKDQNDTSGRIDLILLLLFVPLLFARAASWRHSKK